MKTMKPLKTIALVAGLAVVTPVHAQTDADQSPTIRVLGSVQDGGLPHASCTCTRCEAARADPDRKRHVASLAIIIPVDHEQQRVYLVDATPDITDQLHMLEDVTGGHTGGVNRAPLDGVFLTHAHIGHYLGLAHFGFEAMHTQHLITYCSPRMASFLRSNGPWSQLVSMGNIDIHESAPGQAIDLGGSGGEGRGVTVTPMLVPHRDEFSDTVAYRIEGPTRTLLYMPDCDPWGRQDRWDESIIDILTDDAHPIDIFLVDGTFYSRDELPGRDLSKIGHPLIVDSMDLFAPLVEAGALEVWFTHLNHSNPALEPGSQALAEIHRRGFHVLAEGADFAL